MREWQSQSHVRWYCRYHVVWVPKYRKRAIFGEMRRGIGRIVRELCQRQALGFEPPAPLPERPVFTASFKDLDRWSHEAILRRTIEDDTRKSPYPIVQLGNFIADLKNGWSPKCHNRPAEDNEGQQRKDPSHRH